MKKKKKEEKTWFKMKLFSNNGSALCHSTNVTFTNRSKPCSYIFLKFSDRR